jgi:excisionase family DNA binding protein
VRRFIENDVSTMNRRGDEQNRGAEADDAAMEDHVHSSGRLLVTIREAALVLSVGRTTVYRLIWSGELTPVYIGRSVRLAVEELEAFVDARRTINGDSEAI